MFTYFPCGMLVVIIINRHLINFQLFNYFKNVPFNAQIAEGIWQPDTSFVNCLLWPGLPLLCNGEQDGQNTPIHCIGVKGDGGGGLQRYYIIKLFSN